MVRSFVVACIVSRCVDGWLRKALTAMARGVRRRGRGVSTDFAQGQIARLMRVGSEKAVKMRSNCCQNVVFYKSGFAAGRYSPAFRGYFLGFLSRAAPCRQGVPSGAFCLNGSAGPAAPAVRAPILLSMQCPLNQEPSPCQHRLPFPLPPPHGRTLLRPHVTGRVVPWPGVCGWPCWQVRP